MLLTDLIVSSRPYLAYFDYDNYPRCFNAFSVAFLSLLPSIEETGLERSAQLLLDELADQSTLLSRREQKETAYKDKQVLALFLSPAAVQIGGTAVFFSEELNRLWNLRYPRNQYYIGDYETIMKGFDTNLLGLPLRKSKQH